MFDRTICQLCGAKDEKIPLREETKRNSEEKSPGVLSKTK
jgi:hypothetical protein